MAVTTTLPLFWHLSSSVKEERLDSSVKLISVLEDFQERYQAHPSEPVNGDPSTGEDSEDETNGPTEANELLKVLDRENATDVAYAIRRLLRGLASPRESSRLGFAVALTELLKRIDTISCDQMLALLKATCEASGGLSKQEERDMLFARLFGVKAIIQSGLPVSQKPLKSSSSGTSSLKAFENICAELIELGEKKSWLRESCWWTLCSAIDSLYRSDVPWRDEAFNALKDLIYGDGIWTAEKVAVMIKLQEMNTAVNWKAICGSTFKDPDVLAKANLQVLARILKDSADEGDAQSSIKSTTTPWKPQLHFAWNVILNSLLSREHSKSLTFSDFYRVVVDESLFAGSSSSERKYWGFLVFQECLSQLPPSEIPLLFSKNFMRTWINHLSKDDRYLNKIARRVARDVEVTVEKNPDIGFGVMLQLTGIHGSSNFDQITKTKTVENVLANTSQDGIDSYVRHLLSQINGNKDDEESHVSVDARRAWIVDQVTALLRRSGVPKSNETTMLALDWLVTHTFFVQKPSKKDKSIIIPEPPFSESLRKSCTSKLHSYLADFIVKHTDKDSASNGKLEKEPLRNSLVHVLATMKRLDADTKHYKPSYPLSEEREEILNSALDLLEHLKARESLSQWSADNSDDGFEGIILLIEGLIILCRSDGGDDDWEVLQDCSETAKTIPEVRKIWAKKAKKIITEEERPPIDFIVDVIIGILERSTSFSKALATQSFSHLTTLLGQSAVDLILAQFERRSPNEEENTEEEDAINFDDGSDQNSQSEDSDADEEPELDENDEAALRKAIDAAITNGKGDDDADNDDTESNASMSSMDDEQMMAIDKQLTDVFKNEAERRGKGKNTDAQREATHFKNRVLDLVDVYLKKQVTNVLALKFILPLLDIILTSSTDEKQLSDKTRGILKARFQKAKDTPLITESSEARSILDALHDRARRASSVDAVPIISICIIFVSKVLLPHDEESVAKAYEVSAMDFIKRKTSALNPTFFFDFIRRFPSEALKLQVAILGALEEAANGFRLSQAFVIIQTTYSSLPQSEAKDALSDVSHVADALETTIAKSCTDGKMSAAQMKETLKAAQQLHRWTKRIADSSSSVDKIWVPAKWANLGQQLSSSKHYSSSPSLASICNSIAKSPQSHSNTSTHEEKSTSNEKAYKRKIEGNEDGEKQAQKKSKKLKRSK